MARENAENWSVRKCAGQCGGCNRDFEDKEEIFSTLSFESGAYERADYCLNCWSPERGGLSSWKTAFLLPPPPAEEPLKKENAESLLRRLIAKERAEDLNAVFILMVMLERKKVFVERGSQITEDGRKQRMYEHRKTGETFIVTDPGLRLDELEHVQEEVVLLLGGTPPNKSQPEEAESATAEEPSVAE